MLDVGACLRYYKRPEIQKALVAAAQDKEVSVRYLNEGFGKRPDILLNNSDVLENVRNNASSFHCSEELWVNPMQIQTGMKKTDLDKLRKGWDLVLDIDCPFWELSKITTWLFIEALKAHGIQSISLKFSGNKGFHIGVPFKAFPVTVPGKDILTKDYFPDGPRRIAAYLVEYIRKNLIRVSDNGITFGNKITYSFNQLVQITGKNIDELTDKIVVKNGREVKVKVLPVTVSKYTFQCGKCGNVETFTEPQPVTSCKRCGFIMNEIITKKEKQDAFRRFNPLSIVEVDTVLIAPRHLYRMAYSLHEKSGLASIPVAVERILLFEKDEAQADKAVISEHLFLDDSNTIPGEAEGLVKESFDFNPLIETEEDEKRIKRAFTVTEQITQKIPEELFPPCIRLLLGQLKDGKKRALFLLINFMHSVGWNHDEIMERLTEWNKSQQEPLRETQLVTHINYHKTQKKEILPQNCPDRVNNVPLPHQQNHYVELQVCRPDGLCARVKNPVQYAKKKAWLMNQDVTKVKAKKVKAEKIRCQSCGMPLGEFEVQGSKQDNYGTEADGSKTKEYCKFCYRDGSFVKPKQTVEEMVASSIEFMTTNLAFEKEKAEELSNTIIPELKRWKK